MNDTLQLIAGKHKVMVSCVSKTDAVLTERIKVAVEELGITVIDGVDQETVLGYLASHPPQPVVVSIARFGPEATSFLESVQSVSPDSPIVVILKRDSVKDAVPLIRNGVFECLVQESTIDEFVNVIQAAFDHCVEMRAREIALAGEPWRKCLVGQGPAFERVAKIIALVAPRRCTVLISGETGTGKEMVARAIHQAGDRSRQPMISVNCSALPENLIEAELFGHVKGAFTGAVGHRIGRFEQASGGTLFLDEIGDFPLHLQPKLLRVLQEREIQRLGGAETIKIDVRVIAATNANLLEKVQQGLFREDLYYRLNVIPIHVPTLRERVTDIPLFINHFVRKVCAAERLSVKSVTTGAMNMACAYSWPGNVRQLENIVEQAVVMNADRESLDASRFSFPIAVQVDPGYPITIPTSECLDGGMDFIELLRKFSRGVLDQALSKTQGNKTLAAEMLRIPRTTFVNKLRALELVAPHIPSAGR